VKYLAALDEGAGMVWYTPEDEELVCRLGAPLPLLLERALVLATGRVSAKHADGTVRYAAIDKELAAAVWRIVNRQEGDDR